MDRYGPSPHALVRESSYPYTSGTTGENGKCHYDAKAGVLEVTGFHSISAGPETEATGMLDYLQNHGPVATAVYAEPFQTYASGLLTAEQCSQGDTINHAIQVVGYVDKSDDRQYHAGYWIVRNSWGEHWGEQGYINVEFGKNVCFVADMVTTVTVEKVADGAAVIGGNASMSRALPLGTSGASNGVDTGRSSDARNEDMLQVIV
jgi:cathepsin F